VSGRVLVVGSVASTSSVTDAAAPGETVLGGTFSRFHGGRAATGVAAARLGVPACWRARDDAFGGEAMGALAREVSAPTSSSRSTTRDRVALILVDASREQMRSRQGRMPADGQRVGRALGASTRTTATLSS
jgi:hypothetical protein